MARGQYPRGGRPRTEPVLDHVLQASIDGANGKHHPDTGRYAEIVLRGMHSQDHAREIVRSLYRSAKYMKVSLHQKIEKSGDGYQIRYTVINKEHARRYVNSIDPGKRSYNQHINVVGE